MIDCEKTMAAILVFLTAAVATSSLAQVSFAEESVATSWRSSETGTNVSLRGLSAVNDDVVWASGAEATVIRSLDSGETWEPCGPDGFGDLEFRCVCSFSSDIACIASAGTPAVLLRTEDGGASWQETYRAESEAAFFDAMQFWDVDRGLAVSDPVDGRLLVVETNDGGLSWKELSTELPLARPGEAAFAASNSSLLLGDEGRLWFGTGGAESDSSRLYTRSGWDQPWHALSVPMPSSQAAGIFAVCQGPSIAGVTTATPLFCVGGDYRATETSEVTACISLDDGTTWQRVTSQPASFRSDVMAMPEGSPLSRTLIAVGPAGTDLSRDGMNWTPFSDVGFHALSAGKTKIFACGSEGRFARLE